MPEAKKTKATALGPSWIVGGPGTVLPFAVESFLGWSLAVGCLSVSGYYYLRTLLWDPYWRLICNFMSRSFFVIIEPSELERSSVRAKFPCWLPLTTHTKAEVDRVTPMERYHQFSRLLRYYNDLEKGSANGVIGSDRSNVADKNGLQPSHEEPPILTNEQFVGLLRRHIILRRLATLTMRPADNPHNTDSSHIPELRLGQQLIRCWGELLRIPADRNQVDFPFEMSLIVPCYGEHGSQIRLMLQQALKNCRRPQHVQLILVNAGRCEHLGKPTEDTESSNGGDSTASSTWREHAWGETKVVDLEDDGGEVAEAPSNGNILFNHEEDSQTAGSQNSSHRIRNTAGRGPCLNAGAHHATGRIFSFCHCDTRLPFHWDEKVLKVFDNNGRDNSVRANSCAFGFSIDTSAEGLREGGSYFPPGIRGVEWTANRRCRWWTLPYGDQCLSVPSIVFQYVGGYPHQPIMEDYDLIKLLRQRAALLPQFDSSAKERLAIIPGEPARCSPRRWQKYGVLYVTYTNSKLVRAYESHRLTPHDIYRVYYGGKDLENRISPWEEEMQKVIKTQRTDDDSDDATH